MTGSITMVPTPASGPVNDSVNPGQPHQPWSPRFKSFIDRLLKSKPCEEILAVIEREASEKSYGETVKNGTVFRERFVGRRDAGQAG
jgi:hypothetical protein